MLWEKAAISISCCVLFAQSIGLAQAQAPQPDFAVRIFTNSPGSNMPYRLFIPKDYDEAVSYPIIMYLHGGGGAGADNIKQISGGNTNGTHVWITPENQTKHANFVVAPQLLGSNLWHEPDSLRLSHYAQLAVELLEALQQEFSIDPGRVYLTGQSRGGLGAWDIAGKRPDLFAAAVPLCGGGNPSAARSLRDLPIWAFHGARDTTIPAERSREMVAALRQLGGSVKYTEYPDVGHAVWQKAYLEPELINWLFSQRRK